MKRKIAQYLDPDRVAYIDANERDQVLVTLVDLLNDAGLLQDKQLFFDAIIEREKIVSTAVGMGVAIPHAKLPSYDDFFIAVAILKQGVEWQSMDGAPVRIVFMIGGPDDKQTEYLQILSAITMAVRDEERRKQLLAAPSTEAFIELFTEY